MVFFMIHTGNEGSDHCQKNLHNLLMLVWYFFCNVTTFISCKKAFSCLNIIHGLKQKKRKRNVRQMCKDGLFFINVTFSKQLLLSDSEALKLHQI